MEGEGRRSSHQKTVVPKRYNESDFGIGSPKSNPKTVPSPSQPESAGRVLRKSERIQGARPKASYEEAGEEHDQYSPESPKKRVVSNLYTTTTPPTKPLTLRFKRVLTSPAIPSPPESDPRRSLRTRARATTSSGPNSPATPAKKYRSDIGIGSPMPKAVASPGQSESDRDRKKSLRPRAPSATPAVANSPATPSKRKGSDVWIVSSKPEAVASPSQPESGIGLRKSSRRRTLVATSAGDYPPVTPAKQYRSDNGIGSSKPKAVSSPIQPESDFEVRKSLRTRARATTSSGPNSPVTPAKQHRSDNGIGSSKPKAVASSSQPESGLQLQISSRTRASSAKSAVNPPATDTLSKRHGSDVGIGGPKPKTVASPSQPESGLDLRKSLKTRAPTATSAGGKRAATATMEQEKVPQKNYCPLPCREEQFQTIWNFLNTNLEALDSSCMYVAGVPGTGKTLIVKSVVETLRESSAKNNGRKFKDVYINGLSLSAPNRIWKRFYQELNPNQGKVKMTPDRACMRLELFLGKPHDPIVLIIDELDQVLDKHQAILYRLLDWTAHPTNKLSLICIFNTMNLPENVMTMRNASRMGMARCTFPPYVRDQLATIVQKYLGDEKTAKIEEAIPLLSGKVAAISGDARRAIEIAKRTFEIVVAEDVSAVTAVSMAFQELFSSPKITALKNCSKLEQLVLKMILSDLQNNGSEETVVHSVVSNTYEQAVFEGIHMSTDAIMIALGRLVQSRIIFTNSQITSIHNKLSLNVPQGDIQYALGLEAAR